MADYESIKQAAEALFEDVRACRRHLHAHPELSFREEATAEYLSGELTRAGIPFERVAGTGLLARIEGKGDLREAVVLRADTDALPLQEESGVPFASQNPGVMHACGHDLHAACLLGALRVLNDRKDEIQGTVFGLFQPAEELAPGGASKVLAENPFQNYRIRAFVGEHVAPELPAGTLGLRSGKYMASSDEIRIYLHGRGGHAALPHLLHDPVLCAAELLMSLQQVAARNIDATVPTILSFGRLIAEGATNVIPSEAYLEGTLRTMDETWRAEALQRVRQIAESTGAAHGVQAEVKVAEGGYPCVVNDEEVTRRAGEIFGRLWGPQQVVELSLRMTGEDFGHYTKRYPSLFYRLGVGYTDGTEAGNLHSPTFNPNEEGLVQGVASLATLALEL